MRYVFFKGFYWTHVVARDLRHEPSDDFFVDIFVVFGQLILYLLHIFTLGLLIVEDLKGVNLHLMHVLCSSSCKVELDVKFHFFCRVLLE